MKELSSEVEISKTVQLFKYHVKISFVNNQTFSYNC